MKKLFFLFVLASLMAVYACMDDDDMVRSDEVETTIDFLAQYDGTDLAIQREDYTYPNGAMLKVGLFQYYVSDLTLIKANGDLVVLSEIELIRYGSATDDAIQSRTYNIPAGNYQQLRFGLGVKPELNALDPNNFSAADPLNENEFWNANARYVFAKIEANADLENDGMFDTGLSYHMGNDALYTTIEFNGDFTIEEGNSPRLTVVADVLKAMSDTNATFDITDPGSQTVHGGNQHVAQSIWDRLAAQFTLELR
ncbi:MAG: MbnP family protein [Bacteroidota bacterium]